MVLYQSGHKSSRLFELFESSSGTSFCFIHLSGIWSDCSVRQQGKHNNTNQREVSFHRTDESLTVLFWSDDGRFASSSTAHESRLLDPAFDPFVPRIGSDVI